MKSKYFQDITDLHTKFDVHNVSSYSPGMLMLYYDFRVSCIKEELDELVNSKNADDAVDSIIDMIYFAIGTLECFEVDVDEAWARVHEKNMLKEAGIKPERPNPFGLPDLIKPEGWTAPSHQGNTGLLDKVFDLVSYDVSSSLQEV